MAENTKTHSLENLIEFSKEENTKERVEKLTGILEQGLTELFESETYKRYLSAMAMFHDYSFRNTMLILHQLPTASYVAGFNAWRDHKRYVREGEKSIKIFAPAPYKTKIAEIQKDGNGQIIKDKDGNPVTKEKEITVPAFKAVPVYDISQTDGEPLPELGGGELIGTVDNYENFWQTLKKISPFQIYLEKIEDSEAKGYCHYGKDAKIVVDNDMSEIETISVAIHEISHARLHNYTLEELATLPPEEKKTRRMREVEAESVAFVVCKHFGIETGEASFPYIAGWSKNKEMPELKASLTLIQKTSCDIITEIEENLIALEKEQTKSIEAAQDDDMSTKVREWYMSEHSADGASTLINPDITFEELYNAIGQSDVYKLLGVNDSIIRENCFAKLAEIKSVDYTEIYNKWLGDKGIPDMFNPKIQPVVSIEMTESAGLHKGMQLPLHKADDLFKQLDYVSENGRVEKTRFSIDYVYKCELVHYEGYYNFGEDTGGVINHIEEHFRQNTKDEQLIAGFKEKGPEELEKFNAGNEYALNEFVPYLRFHRNLSIMEDSAISAMEKKTATAEDKAYSSAVCDYVAACRNEINTAEGKYNFPDAPNKADFYIKENTAEKSKSGKKPSIKKQLEKDKEKKADEHKPKKTAKKKSQDLEV